MPANIVNTCCRAFVALVMLCAAPFAVQAADAAAPGETRIARWKDDCTAAFLLMFDDGWPSHWQVAAPELAKRQMIGTFYICPSKGEYQKFADEWENKLPKQGMVYGNHTMTHQGVKDLANAEWEIGECARIIRQISPGKDNRLVSYGQPGVKPDAWNITADQLAGLLKKHRLIDRPTFVDHGAVYHLKTADDMLALADKAIKTQGMEYVVIHGLERIKPDWGYQDFWPLEQAVFIKLLDGLQARRDKGQLWITDHISQHQYETERATAAVKVLSATDERIRLALTTEADPQFYDHPLTLITHVPAPWQQVRIRQGETVVTAKAKDGLLRFHALPGAEVIELQRAIGQ